MKKKYIIIGSILFVYLVLMVLVFNLKLFKNQTYIMVGNNGKIKYDSGYVDMDKSDAYLYNWQWYHVYDDNKYLGKYKIRNYNDRWYAYDKANNYVKTSASFLAIKSNRKYSVPQYKVEELGEADLSLLDKILKENGIREYETLYQNQKIVMDFDGDDENEQLYNVSNLYESNDSKFFSLLYYVDNDKVRILIKKITDKDNAFDAYNYTIQNLIDLKDNQKIELIIQRSCYSLSCNDCYEIYQLKFGKYKKIKGCK